MKINKITPTGKPSFVTVPESIFQVPDNRALVAQAVRVYLSNQRQGTSKVQSRSEVSRTKAKWYKQKGTGRARHGSRNAPIFVGGGVAHGPTGLENWQLNITQKQKTLALKTALSAQIKNIMVSDIPLETEGKTKYAQRFVDMITQVKSDKCLLIYDQQTETKVRRAFANLPKVLLQSAQSLSTYQVAGADKIIFTARALELLTARLEKLTHTITHAIEVTEKPTDSKKIDQKLPSSKPEKKATPKRTKTTIKKTVPTSVPKTTAKLTTAKKIANTGKPAARKPAVKKSK